MTNETLTAGDVKELGDKELEILGWPKDEPRPLAIYFDGVDLIMTAAKTEQGIEPGHLVNVPENVNKLIGSEALGGSEMSYSKKEKYGWGHIAKSVKQYQFKTNDGETITVFPAQTEELTAPGVFYDISLESDNAFPVTD